MRELWLRVLHTTGTSLIALGASAVSLVIATHALGPTGWGIFAAITAWVALATAFGSLSLGQVVIHYVAGKPRETWLRDVSGTLAALLLGVVAVAWLAVWGLYAVTGGRLFHNLGGSALVLGFAALPFLLAADANRYVLNALNALQTANWAQLAGSAVLVAATVALVGVLSFGVGGALVASLLAGAVTAGIGLAYIARQSGGFGVSRVVARDLLRGSSQLHLTAIGNYLFSQASILILNYYRHPEETGYYQLALQLFNLALTVSAAVSTVSFGLVAQKGPNGAWPEHRRLLGHSVLIVSGIAVVGYVLAPVAIPLVAGPKFLPAVPLFRGFLPALVGATFATVMASQWIGRGLFRQAAGITLGAGLVSVATNLVLVPTWGAYGAVASTLVIYGLSVISNLIMALWVERQWSRSRTVAEAVA
jgi:O-antigen/teichoic acid export membrane protein